jgi:hypothetical protein
MRFHAQRDLVRAGSTLERWMAETILVLLDLLEATQDTVAHLSGAADA